MLGRRQTQTLYRNIIRNKTRPEHNINVFSKARPTDEMTEVLNTCDSPVGDFSVGGASGDEGIPIQAFPDSHERIPKLSKRLPSIVVEPTESGEVESGELRWPPDDLTSPNDNPGQIQAAAGKDHSAEEEPVDRIMGGV
ncbi:hypothetical protein DPEC_G00116200 [Dallia pectoralis]|uniref:Uncharacterized protein n=1 Tax=Dallia pectoralis TaxID=75939 RepID=A0ACC2GV29_DALPE|nr:hypothetical protein DPEC_G00116200 [Dallia pectoralis]